MRESSLARQGGVKPPHSKMRIHYFTGGPAGMFCGSCIRDNALAAELMQQGHKVLLLPVYTPTLTDEENVSEHRVFFGGANVYLERYVPLFRRAPRWLTRVLDAPFVLNLLSRISISNNPKQLGELTVSMLRGTDGPHTREFDELLAWLPTQPRPDVVSIPYTLLIRMAAPIKRALGCVVTCTLQGEDLFLESMAEPWRSQSLALIKQHTGDVDGLIAVSDYYAEFMSRYLEIPESRIHVVPLGIRLDGYERNPMKHGAAAPAQPPRDAAALPRSAATSPEKSPPFVIGYFARVAPEKGLLALAEAYVLLRKQMGLPASRLAAAGYLAPEHRGYLAQCESVLHDAGLANEFHYAGVLDRDEKIRFLQSLDVLSVPASYAEPKGLFLLEAMACGTPVVQPRHGAFPEIIAQTGGGLLFEPGNISHLAEKLLALWKNPALREELSTQGFNGVRAHFSVAREAVRAVEVYENLLRIARGSDLSKPSRYSRPAD